MPECVVHVLEVIDIQQDQPAGFALDLPLRQPVIDAGAIVDLCQFIGRGLHANGEDFAHVHLFIIQSVITEDHTTGGNDLIKNQFRQENVDSMNTRYQCQAENTYQNDGYIQYTVFTFLPDTESEQRTKNNGDKQIIEGEHAAE